MSIFYSKEIVPGKYSKRKVLGVPVYYRTDERDGKIIRRYFGGFVKSVQDVGFIKYYLLNILVSSKYFLKPDENINIRELSAKINAIFYENSNLKTLIQCQSLHKETFGPYKNAFWGKDVALVASGPTAKFYKPIEGAIHVGVNNACLMDNVQLDYLFCQDFYMDDEKRQAIVNYRPDKCKKFFGRIPERRYINCMKSKSAQHVRRCPKKFVVEAKASEYYVYDLYQNQIALDIECEPLHAGGIAFAALQFILHAHPKRVYLVGCDCSSGFFYKSDVKFDNAPMIKFWKTFKKFINELYDDIEIISVNPVGLKELFDDIYTDDYLIAKKQGEI